MSLCDLAAAERRLRRCAPWPGPHAVGLAAVSGVEQVCGFVVETRFRCAACRDGARSGSDASPARVVYHTQALLEIELAQVQGDRVSMLELYLSWCAPRSSRVGCPTCGAVADRTVERRMVAAPQLLLVAMLRRGGDGVSFVDRAVELDESVVLPGLCVMDLVGVVYEGLAAPASTQCRAACWVKPPARVPSFYGVGSEPVTLALPVGRIRPREVHMVALVAGGSAREPSAGPASEAAAEVTQPVPEDEWLRERRLATERLRAVRSASTLGARLFNCGPDAATTFETVLFERDGGAETYMMPLEDARAGWGQAHAATLRDFREFVRLCRGAGVSYGDICAERLTRSALGARPPKRAVPVGQSSRSSTGAASSRAPRPVATVGAALRFGGEGGAASSSSGRGTVACSASARSTDRGSLGDAEQIPAFDTGSVSCLLSEQLARNELATGIFAELEREFGGSAERVLNEEWSRDWSGWAELVADVQEADPLPDDAYMTVVLGYVRRAVRKFKLLAVQNRKTTQCTDRRRRVALERDGFAFGRASGDASNCLADSLLQLLVAHGFLRGPISRADSSRACRANREALQSQPELRPRDLHGRESEGAYLEHDRHAAAAVEFFHAWFADRVLRPLPPAGLELHVFTRFDTPTWHEVCFILGTGGPQDGARDRMHLYNSSGRGIWGFHCDPLFVAVCSPGPSPGLRQPRSASAPSSSSSRGGVGELCALFGGARLSAQPRRRTLRRTGSAWQPTPSELRDGGVELLRAVFAGVNITDPEAAVVTAAGCDEGSGSESTSGCGRCLLMPSSGL